MADSSNNIPQFHWADYLVFSLSLLISILIGVYFAVVEKRTNVTRSSDFLMAGRNAQAVPVAMSMLASFTSAIFILGVPAEIYLHGTMFSVTGVGWAVSAVIGAHVYVPIFHRMGITSAYEASQYSNNPIIQ